MKQLLLQWSPSVSLGQPRTRQTPHDNARICASNRHVPFNIKKPFREHALTVARAKQPILRLGALSHAKRVNLHEEHKTESFNPFKLCLSATDTRWQSPFPSVCHALILSHGKDPCRKSYLCRRGRFVLGILDRGQSFVIKVRNRDSRIAYFRYKIFHQRSPSQQSIFLIEQGRKTKFNRNVKADQENVARTRTFVLSSSLRPNLSSQSQSPRNIHSQRSSLSFGNSARNLVHSLITSTSITRKRTITIALRRLNHDSSYLDFKASASKTCSVVSFGRIEVKCRRQFLDVRKFRVNAQRGKPEKSWWKRFLFEKIDSPSLLDRDLDSAESSVPGDASDAADPDNNGAWWSADVDDEESPDFDKDVDNEEKDDIDKMLDDDSRFEAWKRRNDALTELREYKKLGRDPDNTDWEDWLDDSYGDYSSYVGGKDSGWYVPESDWEKGGLPRSPPGIPERGMSRTMKEMLFRIFERDEEVKDDLTFEDRIFRFTSQATAKFVAVLIIIPWFVGFLSHDYVIVPFLRRYVETVPLAAEMLDVRESQKLKMIETLKLERQRVRFEAAIGKAPPLSNDELFEHIRHEALELQEEWRLENRKAFANIWSDALAGLTVFLLLIFNPKSVALMRLTGNRLFTNISDTGKAFIIILLTDIFLGYHSESGWETIVEMFLDHYGFEVEQGSIYVFVAIVPVTIDACFKLWVFRFFTRLSPSAAATFREMKRH